MKFLLENLKKNAVGKCIDWIYLTQNKDKWQTIVKTVVNLQVI